MRDILGRNSNFLAGALHESMILCPIFMKNALRSNVELDPSTENLQGHNRR